MSDREAIYRAICETPDDDLPRLVYADWLDEHGEHDRAAFIRVQCELEQLPPASPEAARLMARHHDLLRRTDWGDVDLLPAGCWPGDAPDRFLGLPDLYRRGFLWRAQVSGAETFRFMADELFRAVPVGAVTLADATPADIAALGGSRELSRLTGLGVRWSVFRRSPGGDPGAGFAALGRSPFAARVTELEVDSGPPAGPSVDGLADTPLLARLRRLRVVSAGFRPAVLAGADALAELVLHERDVPDSDAYFILGIVGDRIERLALRRYPNPSMFRGLPPITPFLKLTWLDLSGNPVTGGVVGELVGAGSFPALRALVLRDCRLEAVALSRLLAAPFAPRLTLLDLTGNRIGEAGADLLCRADLPALEYLGLSLAGLGTVSVAKLRDRFGGRLVVSGGG